MSYDRKYKQTDKLNTLNIKILALPGNQSFSIKFNPIQLEFLNQAKNNLVILKSDSMKKIGLNRCY